jgi:dTDP-4-dehydrorhamnose reductase
MTRILVTGGSGQVGFELRQLSWHKDVVIYAPSRSELDLSKPDVIQAYIQAGQFDAVINAGAYTAVDKAESDAVSAWEINALAAAALAKATNANNTPLIHISSDYVFNGLKKTPYSESDPISPLGVYGASKAAGELAIKTGNKRHVILRTSWVFSSHGNNFVKTMLRLGRERSELSIVNDQRGAPTPASHIATTIASITLKMLNDTNAATGTYHYTGRDDVTWYDFAKVIFARQKLTGFVAPGLKAITTSEYPTPAKRPENSVLSMTRLKQDYGIDPSDWKAGLDDVLVKLKEA